MDSGIRADDQADKSAEFPPLSVGHRAEAAVLMRGGAAPGFNPVSKQSEKGFADITRGKRNVRYIHNATAREFPLYEQA